MTSTALAFQSTTFNAIDHNGKPWLMGTEISRALGYSRSDKIGEIYRRNAEEFTPAMTCTLKLRVQNQLRETRIFSLRGAHLLAMFANTSKAQAFRRWVLDILDRETAVPPAPTFPAQPAVDHYELYQEATTLLCKLGSRHGRGAAVIMLAQFEARSLPGVTRERLPEFIAACKKVLDATASVEPASPALSPQQAEEITQRLDNLARLFHPHSQPFADVMGVSRALRGLDPKLASAEPAFVPLLPKVAPIAETPLRQQVVQTLKAEYTHGDYKALARDLGIHESSAKKIVGRLKLGPAYAT